MKKLPQRPRSHILEKESLMFVQRTLPKEWIIEEGQNDYGVDLVIEIVENGNVTGKHFLMQLKSTDKLIINKKGFISHSCKTSTLQYFLERSELVIYLIYDSNNNMGYWVWIQDFLRGQSNSKWKKKDTFTVKIHSNNAFNSDVIEKIKKRVSQLHKKEKIINTIDTLNNHPGISYGLELKDNTFIINTSTKYPGAEQDYPLDFGLTLDFDNSEEGEKTKKAWEDAFKKGTRAEIKAPFIKEFKIPRELDFENLLFEGEFKPDGLIIQPLKRDRKLLAKVEVFNKEDKLVAYVPYVELKEIRYGTDEVLMSNEEQPIPTNFSILVKIPDREAILSFKLNYSGWNVSQVKDVLKLQEALALGGWINLIHLDTNMTLLKYDFPEGLLSLPLEAHIEIANNLSFVQQIMNVTFPWPDKISIKDQFLLQKVVKILSTGESEEGNSLNFKYDKVSAKRLAEALSKSEEMRFMIDGGDRKINLFGQDLNLGQIRILLPRAKPTINTIKRLSTLEKLGDNEKVKIELEVSEPGIIIQYHNWFPKNSSLGE